ncbi:MAG: hypothetical protein Q7K65_05735 [Candidatus Buchananbacteria bacterium]|nr:hypothetical protein [Candidatus Buchananbacteria bacterium]
MKTKPYQENNSYSSIQKDIALSFDFSEYVAKNDDVLKGLPRNPCIIVIDPKDKKRNKGIIALGKRASNGKGCYVARKSGKEWQIDPLK